MTITSSTGSQIAIASTYGASKNMTAVTNAAEAVATLEASHGIIVNDIMEVTSGWDLLTNRILRAKVVATNDVTLEGFNSSSTSRFPAGSGTGTIREITAWTGITQIKDVATQGGEQQFEDITTIADFIRKQKPTVRNPVSLSLTVFDDPSLSWYAVVLAAANAATPTALRITLPNGSLLYANCYWSLQTTPSIASQQSLTAKIDTSYIAEATRYAS